jgi:S-adenosylmethionine synthetase
MDPFKRIYVLLFIIYCITTMTHTQFITSESVSEGHPDKLCDQISDGVLDAMLEQDPNSRVACECLTTTGLVVVAGEVTTEATIDVQTVVRNVIKKAGYTDASYGIDGDHCSVLIALHEQSPDIAQ